MTDEIVVIRKIFMKSFFFEITIGMTITSGGIGKNELSANEIKLKYHFAFLCSAFFNDTATTEIYTE